MKGGVGLCMDEGDRRASYLSKELAREDAVALRRRRVHLLGQVAEAVQPAQLAAVHRLAQVVDHIQLAREVARRH